MVYAAARDVMAPAGFCPNVPARLGHFMGLEDHEFGDVSASSQDAAVPGNIFSIEPGVYLEGKLGVRIEDVLYLTPEGCQNLTLAPKELVIL